MKKITLSILTVLFTVISLNSQITLVKDIVTTDDNSFPFNFLDGGTFTVFTVFGNNTEIWASDGATANTVNIGANIPEIFNVFESSIVYNSELYFVVENGPTGAELYKTDGTLAGTTILKDINPNFGSTPENFFILNNELFFTADDGTNPGRIWKTNGTEAGTVEVTAKVTFPTNFTMFNGEMYFSADDGTNGVQLWKTNGTDAGTVMVKNINAGGSFISDFTLFNGELFFKASTSANGDELWKTDGTNAGTVQVKDINPGASGSNISLLTVNGSILYFAADDGSNGNELWRTDGTEVGTVLVKDFSGDNTSTTISEIIPFNATTAFVVPQTAASGREIWVTNGTDAGTTLLKDINPGVDSSFFNLIDDFGFKAIVQNGIFYFRANDGTNGNELWKTDGTTVGTVIVKDINNDPNVDGGNSLYDGIINLNNTLIFQAVNNTSGIELWKTDGTEAGTVLIKDINPGVSGGSSLTENIVINNTLFFSGNNGNDGFELWKTDGTSAGTVQIKNIVDAPNGSNPQNFKTINNKLLFTADSTQFSNQRFFMTDGTEVGTLKITNNNVPVKDVSAYVDFGGQLFYYAQTFIGDIGLFSVNAAGTSTTLIKKINPNPNENAGVSEMYYSPTLNKLFFGAISDFNAVGKEPWVSDGTEAGTMMLKEIIAGKDGSEPSEFFEFNGEVYFTTINRITFSNVTKSIWKTDGTEAGTVQVKQFDNINFAVPANFTEYNNKLYFTGFDSSQAGNLLHEFDGNTVNTVTTQPRTPRNLVVIDNKLFFAGRTNNEGEELWVYDGTSATLFKDFTSGNQSGYMPFSNFTDLANGNYYFIADDAGTKKLWKTDGTEAGTVALGGDFTFSGEAIVAGDIIYFSIEDNINGTELWKSDGTPSGTELVEDLFPGEDAFGFKNSSNPSNLTILGNDLFFSAESPNFGSEVFKIENAVLSTETENFTESDFTLKMYPNPSRGFVSLYSNKNIHNIEVFNLLGKKVFTKQTNGNSQESFDVSSLPTGIYIVKTKINSKIQSKKLIIKN